MSDGRENSFVLCVVSHFILMWFDRSCVRKFVQYPNSDQIEYYIHWCCTVHEHGSEGASHRESLRKTQSMPEPFCYQLRWHCSTYSSTCTSTYTRNQYIIFVLQYPRVYNVNNMNMNNSSTWIRNHKKSMMKMIFRRFIRSCRSEWWR